MDDNKIKSDMRKLTHITYILILSCVLLTGCSYEKHDKTLEDIDRIAAVNPDSAQRLLAAVDTKGLNTHDRHYLDFLRVKVNDKNYVTHTSDSLILDFIDYAERHESPAVRDEAYYYAGRVYSDLNDYPDAVRFYQKALDNLPKDSVGSTLHCRILSQTGRLLSNMRLQREAVTYLHEVIRLTGHNRDTVNVVNNLHLLRLAYLRIDSLDSARICASKALELCPDNNIHLKAKSRMLLAEVFYLTGRNDTALKLIRHAPEEVKAISRNAALSIAADIYERAGIKDTAWMYVRDLIESPDTLNRHNGYRLILSSSLADDLPRDTMRKYMVRYHDALHEFYNFNNAEQVALQQTAYNYTQHERARAEAESESRDRMVWIAVLGAVSVILLLTSMVLYEKQKRRRLELEVTKTKVRQLENALHINDTSRQTRQELIETLRRTYDKGLKMPLDDGIRDSEEYMELRRRIDGNLSMGDDDPYWVQMDRMMSEVFPKLKGTLMALTGGSESPLEWHVAMMAKCKVSQVDMARLLGVSRSAVAHRLAPLAKKILGNEATSRMLTGAIMLIG